jgi:hypothetical protein
MDRFEEMEATKEGLTLRVYRLQQHLRRLPLIPCNDRQRETRDGVSKQLIQAARKDGCLAKINLMAGRTEA